jgi:hypothetical protein
MFHQNEDGEDFIIDDSDSIVEIMDKEQKLLVDPFGIIKENLPSYWPKNI